MPCNNFYKGYAITRGSNPPNENFTRTLLHEFGHQFNAAHTFSVRPGSNLFEIAAGNSIMAYSERQFENTFYHPISIEEITNHIKILDTTYPTCGKRTNTNNTIPTVNGGLNYIIPKSTPFILNGNATDLDNSNLTFSWEQYDKGTENTYGQNSFAFETKPEGPIFSSSLPSISRNINFRFTAFDNNLTGGANNSDDMKITVNANTGPDMITSQNSTPSNPYNGNDKLLVNWNVAGTDTNNINCTAVDVFYSTDAGKSWILLLAKKPNDGAENITLTNI